MIKLVLHLWDYVLQVIGLGRRSWRAVAVEDPPQKLFQGRVYLIGEDGLYWCAMFLCPCGCGEAIRLNLLQQVRPNWTVQITDGSLVTLAPSVWRKVGCESHFFIRRGRIEWCTKSNI
jgi:hypothetical protein